MSTFSIGEFRFETGPDPEDVKHQRVLVFKNDAPFTNLHGEQMSKNFPLTAGPARVEQFCRRFATDDAYRTAMMLKHAFACC